MEWLDYYHPNDYKIGILHLKDEEIEVLFDATRYEVNRIKNKIGNS
jgi:hypothetical protein